MWSHVRVRSRVEKSSLKLFKGSPTNSVVKRATAVELTSAQHINNSNNS